MKIVKPARESPLTPAWGHGSGGRGAGCCCPEKRQALFATKIANSTPGTAIHHGV